MTKLDRACILVAENDVLIRNLISMALNNDGHFVLAAANHVEAIELSRTFAGDVRLLITKWADVAAAIGEGRPQTRILLLSEAMVSELKAIVRTLHPSSFLTPASLPQTLRDCIQQKLA